MTDPVVLRRSLLMTSALSPDEFRALLESGADMVCADLEDGTAIDRKAEARAAVFDMFAGSAACRRLLRVNSPRTANGMRDLLGVIEAPTPPDGIILPKVSCPEDVAQVADVLRPASPDIEILALIESPEGLRRVDDIAVAAPELTCLIFGTADYSAEIGSNREWDALIYGRSRIVNAAKHAHIDAMDGAWFDPHDEAGFLEELNRVVGMGFTGKISYEAAHVAPIHAALTPTAEEIEEARQIIATAEADRVGIARLDGRMVNESIVRSARRILAAAARSK